MKRLVWIPWLSLVVLSGVTAAAAPEMEAECLAVLASDTGRFEKAEACRVLAVTGTARAVPILAALLADAELSHNARTALQEMSGDGVDEALRKALGELFGRPLIGVVGTVGYRRDPGAVALLAARLTDPDSEVSGAAARALGSIGTVDAGRVLLGSLGGAPSSRDLVEGVLRCGEHLIAEGQVKQAADLYDRLGARRDLDNHVRRAVFRGSVLARGRNGTPRIANALTSGSYADAQSAVATALEIGTSDVAAVLASVLPNLDPDRQILVSGALGVLGAGSAANPLIDLAREAPPEVRAAALAALPGLEGDVAVPALFALAEDPDVGVLALRALGAMPKEAVVPRLMELLTAADPGRRERAVGLLHQRRVDDAIPHLLRASRDQDEAVRVAALKALGDLASADQFAELVLVTVRATSPGTLRAGENALSEICARETRLGAADVRIEEAVYGVLDGGPFKDVTDHVASLVGDGKQAFAANNANFGDAAPGLRKQLRVRYRSSGAVHDDTVEENQEFVFQAGTAPRACVDPLVAVVSQASPEAKAALFRVLRTAGGPRALSVVVDGTRDSEAAVRSSAVSTLSEWQVDALPALLELAAHADDSKSRILAQRGCLRLIPQQDKPNAAKLADLHAVLPLLTRVEEQRRALSALGKIPGYESLALAATYLDQAALREEAALAAVTLAESDPKQAESPESQAVLKTVLESTQNPATANRIRQFL